MPYLYRSPNIVIDGTPWHIAVVQRPGRSASTIYKWRAPNGMWRSVTEWPGRKPKGLSTRFRSFWRSVAIARQGATGVAT